MRPCMGVVVFSYAILQTLSSFVYAGKGQKPQLRRVLSFDNFLLLYVHMLLVALTYMLAS